MTTKGISPKTVVTPDLTMGIGTIIVIPDLIWNPETANTVYEPEEGIHLND